MDSVVSDLANDSGPLAAVWGVAAPGGGRYRLLEFEFASGVLSLACDDDTDEIIVQVGGRAPGTELLDEAWVEDLLGKWIEYAWELRNHRRYRDAFQIRLIDDQRSEAGRVFEVAGSTVEVRLVEPRSAAG